MSTVENGWGLGKARVCATIRGLMAGLFFPSPVDTSLMLQMQHTVLDHLDECAACAEVYTTYERIDAVLRSLFHDPPFELVRDLLLAQQEGAESVVEFESTDECEGDPPVAMRPELAAMLDAMRRGEDVSNLGNGSTRTDDADECPGLSQAREGEAAGSGLRVSEPAQEEYSEETHPLHNWDPHIAARTARTQEHGVAAQKVLGDMVARAVSTMNDVMEDSRDLPAPHRLELQQATLVGALQREFTPLLDALANSDQAPELIAAADSGSRRGASFLMNMLDSDTERHSYAHIHQAAIARATPEPTTRSVLQQSSHGRPVIQALRQDAAALESAGNIVEDIHGTLPSLEAAVHFLTWTAASVPPGSYPCIVTWRLDDNVFWEKPTLLNEWNSALRRLVERGWDVKHLVYRSTNKLRQLRKATAIAENLHALLGATGCYEPYFVTDDASRSEHIVPGHGVTGEAEEAEYVIVPGVGAVTLVAGSGNGVTHAQYISHGSQLDSLVRRFSTTWRAATCVYSACYRWPDKRYHEAIVRLEQQPGDRYVLVDGLSDSAVPYFIHRQRAARLLQDHPERRDEILHVLALQKLRTAAVLHNIQGSKFFDVTSRRAIKRLVRERKYQAQGDIWSVFGAADLTPAQVHALLTVLIRRLEMHSTYHLLLVDDHNADLCRTEFLVKPDHAAFVEYWLANASGQRVRSDVEIVEPAVIEAYSKALWQEVTVSAERRKDKVLEFLREQLAAVDHC